MFFSYSDSIPHHSVESEKDPHGFWQSMKPSDAHGQKRHRQELFVSLFTVEGRPLIGHLKLKNTKYALRAARPRVVDGPAGGWLPEGRIVMTP
jgi:hypothetical protein